MTDHIDLHPAKRQRRNAPQTQPPTSGAGPSLHNSPFTESRPLQYHAGASFGGDFAPQLNSSLAPMDLSAWALCPLAITTPKSGDSESIIEETSQANYDTGTVVSSNIHEQPSNPSMTFSALPSNYNASFSTLAHDQQHCTTSPGINTGVEGALFSMERIEPSQGKSLDKLDSELVYVTQNQDQPEQTSSSMKDDEIVCFGAILGIAGECEVPRGFQPLNSGRHAVTLEAAQKFSFLLKTKLCGSISSQKSQLLQGILDEPSLRLQVTCDLEPKEERERTVARFVPQVVSCALSIILYGPVQLSEELGDYLQSHGIYLQDPQGCDMNVRYYNPHRLSSLDQASCPMTFDLEHRESTTTAVDMKEVPSQPDLLAILNTQQDLPEAPQPNAVQTILERHQKQALSFMLQREQGWDLDEERPDIWKMTRTSQGYFFINRISNSYQSEEPIQFRGGIIADPMGLGKTLTMIALIATDLQKHRHGKQNGGDDMIENSICDGTTLVIVPPPLLDTWEEQLSQHVVKSALTWSRHHSKSRLTHKMDIKSLNLVLTTYHTVSAEWKSGSQADPSILFSTHWKRVVLDEAHFIRNSGSQMAKSVCALNASSRWAVTGTPIQNRLADLAGLLKFLQVYPYDDTKRFETDFTQLWKCGDPDEAVKRLQKLSRCILLRRPKETINLPPRRDLRCAVEFTIDERKLYGDIKSQTVANITDSALETAEMTRTMTFDNVIQQINSLRMICSMGLHYHTRHKNAPLGYEHQEQSNWSQVAQRTFNFDCEMASVVCHLCSTPLGIAETLFGETQTQLQPQYSQCRRFICLDCVQRQHLGANPITCGHQPPHSIMSVFTNFTAWEEAEAPMASEIDCAALSSGLPSKVTALITQLKDQPAGIKSVVFSTWRMTLDVVEEGLKQAQISYLRFDGKVPQRDRHKVIERFRKDLSVRVMLLTLSCGAVGLTLTEASYAYLMEPHWNPTIEEQALARVHRIGQRKEVTTVRFFIRDTFEERVMEVQESKKDLASVLFSSHEKSEVPSAKRLEWLCNLL